MGLSMNNIIIVQGGNEYQLYLPNYSIVAHVAFPSDRQHLQDMKALDSITKALAMRWNVYKGKNANCKCKLDTLGRMSGGYLGNVNIVQECLK